MLGFGTDVHRALRSNDRMTTVYIYIYQLSTCCANMSFVTHIKLVNAKSGYYIMGEKSRCETRVTSDISFILLLLITVILFSVTYILGNSI